MLKQFLERDPTKEETVLYNKYKNIKECILSKDVFGGFIVIDGSGKVCF